MRWLLQGTTSVKWCEYDYINAVDAEDTITTILQIKTGNNIQQD